jgi:ribosome-associated protein
MHASAMMIANGLSPRFPMTAPPDRTLRREDAPDGQQGTPAPSKSRLKKDMHALQDLGAMLVELEPSKLAALDLPERLVDAIALARSITKHEARRRQMQYVGRLMRDVDPEPIRAALQRNQSVSHVERAQFAAAERWRDRLLADELAVAEFIGAHPGTDAAKLLDLVREARGERASGRPPHKFRALFRLISRHVAE